MLEFTLSSGWARAVPREMGLGAHAQVIRHHPQPPHGINTGTGEVISAQKEDDSCRQPTGTRFREGERADGEVSGLAFHRLGESNFCPL